MTKVFVAPHPTEAHLVAGYLTDRGIPSEVRGEALFAVRGEVPITPATLPTVWVLDDGQAAEALEVLRARPSQTAAGQPLWTCNRCGELIEPQFTACWQCGAARPDVVGRAQGESV